MNSNLGMAHKFGGDRCPTCGSTDIYRGFSFNQCNRCSPAEKAVSSPSGQSSTGGLRSLGVYREPDKYVASNALFLVFMDCRTSRYVNAKKVFFRRWLTGPDVIKQNHKAWKSQGEMYYVRVVGGAGTWGYPYVEGGPGGNAWWASVQELHEGDRDLIPLECL